ncbi:hypothetical protein F4818DRAFT_425698 [Hypoxylon cercidicola]|nr:hypothetical protein F4818DRAFT_425698 [Hypoxylon cercidicola]
MADVYRRSGRGGAGNFYSQKDVEEATKTVDSSKDLEAQKQQPADEIPTDPADYPPSHDASTAGGSTAQATYARTGRGGAGNFVDPASAPAPPSSSSAPASPSSTARAAAATAVARSGHSGRGGAGNWTTEEGGGAYDAEQERKRREALDAHILQDIRNSLPQPPRIHYMHGPGRGRKPDLLPTS